MDFLFGFIRLRRSHTATYSAYTYLSFEKQRACLAFKCQPSFVIQCMQQVSSTNNKSLYACISMSKIKDKNIIILNIFIFIFIMYFNSS